MTKRDLIQEIQEKNERAKRLYLHGHIELYSIERSARDLTDTDRTLLALHVMGMAACIEVSVREAIKRLIDSGSPYLDRAQAFKDHMRFDFNLTKALSTRQITFGDLVAHSLPVSNLGHIASHIEVLCSDGSKKFQSILAGLREFVEPDVFGESDEASQEAPQFVADAKRLCEDVSSIFELRHLVAHEASFSSVTHEVFVCLLESSREFVKALYELVEQNVHPKRSRNGFGQSIQYMEEAQKVAISVSQLAGLIRGRLEERAGDDRQALEKFDLAAEAFESYFSAEESLWLAVHQTISGNAMRNIEARVTLGTHSHRLEMLRELDDLTKPYIPANEVQGDE